MKSEGQRASARVDRARESRAYGKAKTKAEEYMSSPEKLQKLLDDAANKVQKKTGPLAEVWEALTAALRLIKAYANGTYRDIPWPTITMIVASIIYFVMPLDLVPDFLVGLGLVDDAALLGWTFKSFASDIDAFREWEAKHA